ncbi:hypothetical protein [Treponema sp.]|uniref:hypothetical protein n=1 Tax=Treponema sp. TaxID=166 RepID=UPI003EFE4C1A
MKKILAASLAGALACASVFAQSFTITNWFGANDDNQGHGDFLEFNRKQKDNNEYDDGFTNEDAHVDNRLQFDFSSEKLDGRVRLETQGVKLNGKESQTRLRGFVRYAPLEMLNIALGNEFFTKIAIEPAYLPATDDTPAWGCMAKNGFAVTALPVEGLKLVGGIRGDTDYDDNEEYKLDLGAQYKVADVASIGGTAKSVTNGNRTFGVFAGLNSVENLLLSAGFIYNANETGFLYNGLTPECTDEDSGKAKYALQASFGYDFKDAGFSIYADVVSGLSSKYIKKVGDDYESVDHKNNDGDKGIPFKAKVLANYSVKEDTILSLALTEEAMFGWDDSLVTTVYPYATFILPDSMGNLDMGVRLSFAGSDGLVKFSVPFTWKWKLSVKK